MARLKSRVEDLEASKPSLPVIAFFEKPGGAEGVYFRDAECSGEPVTAEELASLEKSHQIILVEYRADPNSLAVLPAGEELLEEFTYTKELIDSLNEPEPPADEVEIPEDLDSLSSDEINTLFEKVRGKHG